MSDACTRYLNEKRDCPFFLVGEMQNLATDPHYAEVRNEHRRRMAEWCEKTGDATFMPHLIAPED